MEKRGIGEKLKSIPDWAGMVFKIGGFIFFAGVMYNDVQNVKSRLDKYEGAQVQQVRMEGEISNLQLQIKQGQETQKQTIEAVTKLADAVNNLSVSVATLQTKLDDNKKRR